MTHYKEPRAESATGRSATSRTYRESGGTPYRFKPESYARYYGHTVAAIRRSQALVGGLGPGERAILAILPASY
ncbi:MAG: hypothetical protein U0790_10115 [Isosphaeraceae bacterium]